MAEERQEGMGGGKVAADELRLLIERAERLEEEKREDYQEEEAILETYMQALGML